MKQFVLLFALALTLLPAHVSAQASRRDSLLIAEAVADTVVALARADSAHRVGVLTMDRLQSTAAHFEANFGRLLIAALLRRLPSRLDTIFSGDATHDQDAIPAAVTRLWIIDGARILGDSARVELTTMYFHRATSCTFGSTDETLRLRREENQWRIAAIEVNTYADGICKTPGVGT